MCSYSKENYDRGVNTFSPEGRIYQIEYAIEAIKVCKIFTQAHQLTQNLVKVRVYSHWCQDK